MEKKIAGDKTSETWLNSQKKDTKCAYRSHWRRFSEFTKMTGDAILAHRKTDKEFYWESKVLEFKTWLINEKELSSNSAMTATQAIRGFFAFYRVPLVFQRRETRKIGEHVRKTEDYRFSIADLAKMDAVADLTERYVLRAGKTLGLRAGDFLRLTRGDLEPYVKNEPPASIGAYKTQKEGVTAWPFLDRDSTPIIQLMLEKLTREGKTEQTDRVLVFRQKLQLSRVLRRLVLKAGIDVGNKQVRFHCMRKFLCDHLSSYMAESRWKQIVGKKITEGAYISPDNLRADFARAMADISFPQPRADLEKRQEASERIMSKILAGETLTEQDRTDIHTYGIQLREKATQRPRTQEDCTDGEHCPKFEEIGEAQLLDYLRNGWQITQKLSEGFIVSRE